MTETPAATADVLASIAHDLRSPLNAVIGFSRIMLKGIDGPLSDLQKADLEAIYANGNTMLEMVDDLIDLAKAESGWFPPSRSTFHLDPLLEKVISLSSARARESQVEIVTTPGLSQPVEADQGATQKALERFTAAVIHLTGTGQVTIDTREKDGKATVSIVGIPAQGLSPEVTSTIAACHAGGTSAEHRISSVALQFLVGQALLAPHECACQIDTPSDQEVCIACDLPLAPL
jgi:K+-sensing histidine kinase KdpD